MLCKNPISAGAGFFGCGQCLPCRISRKRIWTWRQYLESLHHQENCFVTLTYDDAHMPAGNTLVPAHLRDFLKRFRKALAPARVRFFAVGEYGEAGARGINPHYHLSLFGVSGRTDVISPQRVVHYGVSQLIHDCWGQGLIFCAEFNELTAQYVAGYVTKKLTAKDDPKLEGRHPEFSRMSNRPGIGALAIKNLAEQFRYGPGHNFLEENGDIPTSLKIGKRSIPLGRYLIQKLREGVGFTPEYISEIKNKKALEHSLPLLALYSATVTSSSTTTLKKIYLEEVHQKILQTESRHTLWKKKGRI